GATNRGRLRFDQILVISRARRAGLFGQLAYAYTHARRNYGGVDTVAANRDYISSIGFPENPTLLYDVQNQHSLTGFVVWDLPLYEGEKSGLGWILLDDWQITANDSSNGGAEKFSIDDITGGRTPFTVEAGAPSHSLYVDDGGRLGFGTSTPVADLHVKSGNTPTLRLEQDGSSGFTPQTWDVAGNEANFFIRDATNGSTLPIRLRPGAPTSAIDIAASGDIGLGTSSPGADLH
ncbi:MAG: hypothetical protein GY778_20920, partial [bacterium]|nr:hypothetical protein [bacterium]